MGKSLFLSIYSFFRVLEILLTVYIMSLPIHNVVKMKGGISMAFINTIMQIFYAQLSKDSHHAHHAITFDDSIK